MCTFDLELEEISLERSSEIQIRGDMERKGNAEDHETIQWSTRYCLDMMDAAADGDRKLDKYPFSEG